MHSVQERKVNAREGEEGEELEGEPGEENARASLIRTDVIGRDGERSTHSLIIHPDQFPISSTPLE